MINAKARPYEEKNDKNMNFDDYEGGFYIESKKFNKEVDESLKDLLTGTLELLGRNFIDSKRTDVVVSNQMATCSKDFMGKYSKDEEMIKSILEDSWALAEEIDQSVSHCYNVKGIAYCSSCIVE